MYTKQRNRAGGVKPADSSRAQRETQPAESAGLPRPRGRSTRLPAFDGIQRRPSPWLALPARGSNQRRRRTWKGLPHGQRRRGGSHRSGEQPEPASLLERLPNDLRETRSGVRHAVIFDSISRTGQSVKLKQ